METQASSGSSSRTDLPQMEPPRPEGLDLVEDGKQLSVTMKWWRIHALFLALFTIFWCAITGSIVIEILVKGHYSELLFLGVHAGAAVALAYYTLSLWLNSTRIAVEDAMLVVSHGPLPWRGGKSIALAQLDQLYCTEEHGFSMHRWPQQSTLTCSLKAVVEGRAITLLSGLPDRETALFLERRFEQQIGLPDRRVPGELPH